MLEMALADVPFGDKEAWRAFLFEHALEHERFANAILASKGARISAVVFPDEGDMQTWLQENANAHAEELQAIGVEGYVPSDIDLTDEQAYNDWMAEHAMIHQITQQALGL